MKRNFCSFGLKIQKKGTLDERTGGLLLLKLNEKGISVDYSQQDGSYSLINGNVFFVCS